MNIIPRFRSTTTPLKKTLVGGGGQGLGLLWQSFGVTRDPAVKMLLISNDVANPNPRQPTAQGFLDSEVQNPSDE